MSAFPNANKDFPKLSAITSHQVTVEERITAIDFVNRFNYLLEEFDTGKILSTMLPDTSVSHTYGAYDSTEAIRGFLESQYAPIIPGVSRHATNHIVDRDEETGGVVIRYQNVLIRHLWPEDAGKATPNVNFTVTDMPSIWTSSSVADRLKMTDEGWRLYQKGVGATVVNGALTPKGIIP